MKKQEYTLPWWQGSGHVWYDRHEQLEKLFHNACGFIDPGADPLTEMDAESYWAIVEQVWKRTEFPSRQKEAWYTVFSAASDPTAYTKQWLQTPQIVYRGIDARFEHCDCDWSWTTDKDKAVWFSKRFGWEKPKVLEFDTSTDPQRVQHVFQDDSENEVLLWSTQGSRSLFCAYERIKWEAA